MSKELVPSDIDPEIQALLDKAKENGEKRFIAPDATPEERFDGLVRNLRESMRGQMITFVDSDAAELFYFLKENPELSTPEELDQRLDILNDIVNFAWKAPGWEDALNRLRGQKLTPTDSLKLLS